MLKPSRIESRSITEVAPWATNFTPKVILDKDGSLLAAWKYQGIDADSPIDNEASLTRGHIDAACKNFDGRITAWWRFEHRRAHEYIGGVFRNSSDAALDELSRASAQSGKYFQNDQYLALAYTPATGLNKFFDHVTHHMSTGGKKPIGAFFEAVKDMVLSRNAFTFDLTRIQEETNQFETKIDAFTGGINRLKPRRLEQYDLLEFLHQTANPPVPRRRIRWPTCMLDNHLTETRAVIGRGMIRFDSAHGECYATVLVIKEWLGFTEAALQTLGEVDAELDISICYRFLDRHRMESYIRKIRSFYKFANINVWEILKGMFAKDKDETDTGRELLATEADKALARVTAENGQFGFVNVSMVVYGRTEEECTRSTAAVISAISSAGFSVIWEKKNLFAAWATTLPGQWQQQKRWSFVETPCVSDVVPVESVHQGKKVNEWLTSQSGVVTPPLAMMPTRHKTLQRVDFHQPGGAAHVLVVGKIGAGKSILLNWLMSQADRHNAQRIRIDKDRSTRIPTVLSGGNFIDVTGKYSTAAVHVNPLSLIHDSQHWSYVAGWVGLLIECSSTYRLTPTDESAIYEQIGTLASYTRERWRLKFLYTLLPHHLRPYVKNWTEGEKDGRFFDHAEDAFQLADNLSIEMGDLIQNYPKAAGLFIDYFFYRVEQWLDGKRYTIIEVEEAGFFFTDPVFQKRLPIWVVTIRKRNGAIWFATQSLSQLMALTGWETLKENIPNVIYLPNPTARTDAHIYRDKFGLSDTQIDMIANAVPNRDYFWVTPTASRMLQTDLSPHALARLRSDGMAQDTFDRFYEARDVNARWAEDYVEHMARAA